MKSHITLAILILLWCIACSIFVKRQTRNGEKVCLGNFSRDDSLPLRGILAIMVMCGHLLEKKGVTLGFIPFFSVQTCAVGVFLFISGFGTVKAYLWNSEKYLINYVQRMSKKLLFPLFCVSILGAFLIYATQHDFRPLYILDGYLHGKTRLAPHTWFVFELFALSCGFYFLSIRFKTPQNILLLVAYSAVLHIILRWGVKWHFMWYVSVFAFSMGGIFAYYENKIRYAVEQYGTWCYLIIGLILFFLLGGYAITGKLDVRLVCQSLIGIPFIMCSWILPISTKMRTFYWLGGIAYELYLIHGLIMEYLWRFLEHFDLIKSTNLRGIIIIVVSICAAWIFHLFIAFVSGKFDKNKLQV